MTTPRSNGRERLNAGEGYMYVAEIIGTDRLKVGFSLDPANRVKSLSRNYQGPMRLLGQFPASYSAVRAFHARFSRLQAQHGFTREVYPRSALQKAAA